MEAGCLGKWRFGDLLMIPSADCRTMAYTVGHEIEEEL